MTKKGVTAQVEPNPGVASVFAVSKVARLALK